VPPEGELERVEDAGLAKAIEAYRKAAGENLTDEERADVEKRVSEMMSREIIEVDEAHVPVEIPVEKSRRGGLARGPRRPPAPGDPALRAAARRGPHGQAAHGRNCARRPPPLPRAAGAARMRPCRERAPAADHCPRVRVPNAARFPIAGPAHAGACGAAARRRRGGPARRKAGTGAGKSAATRGRPARVGMGPFCARCP